MQVEGLALGKPRDISFIVGIKEKTMGADARKFIDLEIM